MKSGYINLSELPVHHVLDRVRQFGADAFKRVGDWSPAQETHIATAAANVVRHLDDKVTSLTSFLVPSVDASIAHITYGVEYADDESETGCLTRTVTYKTGAQPTIVQGPHVPRQVAGEMVSMLNRLQKQPAD